MDPTPAESSPARAPATHDGPPPDLPPVEPPTAGFIIQLFVIPAIIVAVVVVVWLLFGKLAGGERDAMSYVATMKSPSANWRAAYELASLIKNDPKLARDPKLLGELARLLDQDINLKADPELLRFLAASLGAFKTLDATTESGEKVDVLAVLAHALDPSLPDAVRKEAATSLAEHAARMKGELDDPRAIDALAAVKGSDNEALRTYAVYALGFFGPRRDPGPAGLARRQRPRRPLQRRGRARPPGRHGRGGEPPRDALGQGPAGAARLVARHRAAEPDRVDRAGRPRRARGLRRVRQARAGPIAPRRGREPVALGPRLSPEPSPGAFEKFTSRAVKKRPSDGPKRGDAAQITCVFCPFYHGISFALVGRGIRPTRWKESVGIGWSDAPP